MQIIEKYKADYEEAMSRFMDVRKRYVDKLAKIPALRVFHFSRRITLCVILNGMSSRKLADIMLNKYNILIKDLSTKRKT